VDIFSYDQHKKGINYILNVHSDISNKNGLIEGRENWEAICYNKAKFLIENGFRFDLAYTSCELLIIPLI